MSNHDEDQAVTFFKLLFQHCDQGTINLRFVHKENPQQVSNEFIALSEIERIPKVVKKYEDDHHCFFGVATRIEGDGTKGGISQIPVLWADFDWKGLSPEERDRRKSHIRDHALKLSLSVNSGGGAHVYWLLREPASKEEIPQVEDILKRLASEFGGDPAATDASRMLRIPGTQNHKYPGKIIATLNKPHPERQYNLSDFDSILPPLEQTSTKSSDHHPPKGWEEPLLKGVEEGQRNEAITRLAGRYIGKGLSREEILPILLKVNTRFKPPLLPSEIEVTLDSVMKTHLRNHPPASNKTESIKHHFSLVRAKDIISTPSEDIGWLWENILPAGGLSLVVAKPKVGKTTFSFNLAIATSRGDDFLGRKTKKGAVVYLALEEHRKQFESNLSKRGIDEEPLSFHFGPAPVEAIKEVEPLIQETGAKLLVIDVLQKFCRVRDLNDYAQVTRALEPLMATARQLDCHIQLIHHAGKRDRPDGDDILGSTGLLGGVDTSIHLKRRSERRTFFTIQRYGEDVHETVIALREDGSLEAMGGREEVEIQEICPLILDAMKEGALSEKEIGEYVERNRNLISKALRRLLEEGAIKRSGSGKRGDPFRYENSLLLYSDTIE